MRYRTATSLELQCDDAERRAIISPTTKSASSRSSSERTTVTRSPAPCVARSVLPMRAGVGADHRIRQVEDLRRRAIVLLEPNDGGVREILVEVEDVPNVGAAPAVDRLIVVADDADVAVLAAEQLDQLVLRAVGVLILVDEDVAKALAIAARASPGCCCSMRTGSTSRSSKSTAFASCSASPSESIDRRDGLRERIHRELLEFGRRDQRVLRVGDRPTEWRAA